MIYRIQYWLVLGMMLFVNLMPFLLASRLAKRIGDLFYRFAPGRRKIALGNLDKAYGNTLSSAEKKSIIRRSFENTALSILELFSISKIKNSASRRFEIKGLENMKAALAPGKGAVLITSHLGSWEYLEFLFYLTGIPCSVIVKNVKNPFLNRTIDGLRRQTSVVPLPKNNGAIREVFAQLKKNNVVAVLVDQWAGPDGLWGDFFGAPTSTTSLPARLAQRTGCALIPAYCVRKENGQYEIQVHPPIFLKESVDKAKEQEMSVTQNLNRLLETQILKYPDQWSWAHRRWKKKPQPLPK